MNQSVRIETATRYPHQDVIDELNDTGTTVERRPGFADGRGFLFAGRPTKPDGFCNASWQAIYAGAILTSLGANPKSITVPNAWIACRPDGLRPAAFAAGRVDDLAGAKPDSKEER